MKHFSYPFAPRTAAVSTEARGTNTNSNASPDRGQRKQHRPTGASKLPAIIGRIAIAWACSFPAPVPADAAETPVVPRIVVFYDQTGSRGPSRVDVLAAEQLGTLVDLVVDHGGELAFGTIDAISFDKLVRMSADSPPAVPEEPAPTGNALRDRKQRADYEAAIARHEEVLAAARQRAEKERTRFLEGAELLLRQDLAPCTDVLGALVRGSLLLEEPHLKWPKSEDYLVLITDGVHNVTEVLTIPDVPRSIHVAVVNGTGELGVMQIVPHTRFESIDSAFAWVRDDFRKRAER